MAACGTQPPAKNYDFTVEAHFKNTTIDTFTLTGESVTLYYDGELYVYRNTENYRIALNVNYFKILKQTEIK